MAEKDNQKKEYKWDKQFELILSIVLAISMSTIFEKFAKYQTGSFIAWVVLSILLFALSIILIYYLVNHKSIDHISYSLKIIILYLLVFFPFYIDKLQDSLKIEWYILFCSVFFVIWGVYESIKTKGKWYSEPRFLIGITSTILMIILICEVLK